MSEEVISLRAFVVMIEIRVNERYFASSVSPSVRQRVCGWGAAQHVPSVALIYVNWTPSDLIVAQLRSLPCQLETSHP